jgi:ubiquinone/menaquinone biosynthesis C-methylase UbiE
MERIRTYLRLEAPVPRALDVGCGTGLSTLALKGLACQVLGVDPVAAMIACARPDPAITYVVGSAEQLPVEDATIDLVTVASALHWLATDRFFAEARRVLRPAGWLVVYDNYLVTQSNIIAAVEGGQESLDAARSWLRDAVLPFFGERPTARFRFVGPISYLQRV